MVGDLASSHDRKGELQFGIAHLANGLYSSSNYVHF